MLPWWIPLIVAALLAGNGRAHADPYFWPTFDAGPGSRGFATVTVEAPEHAGRVKGPNITIRLHSDNQRAAVLVRLDGKHIDRNCNPFLSRTDNPNDYPQWEFMQEQLLVIEIPVCGVAPGLHTLEVVGGHFGSSLPATNGQRIFFTVE